ncbi:hypothetical protein DEW08_29710 (plasmid) [Azospirillum thermophilum]|uniref:Uncharacterized protein n=2 Tax=Azospirillum thermophilum TaxID=2202148 RepID=A0A2S2D0B6_9PROT|nr:hypothetical protein DEW08_29710 [Azospirillum thermophilum]
MRIKSELKAMVREFWSLSNRTRRLDDTVLQLEETIQRIDRTVGSLPDGAGLTAQMEQALAPRLNEIAAQSAQAAGYGAMLHHHVLDAMERSLLLSGRMASRSLPRFQRIRNLAEVEFKVFSQWGEDGIIDWLAAHVPVPNTRFVEFGVENFREANCRFLLMNRNWRGLVMDGSEDHMRALRSERLYWMHDLTAVPAFITAENINDLLDGNGFGGPLGILSVDIDGNDYWVWKAVTAVDPAIVICEYNPILGDTRPVVVPYDPSFTRFAAHHSGLYFGASIAALRHLAEQRGYEFLGTNSNGINAFFVRHDLAHSVLPYLEEIKAFPSRHRDSRDAEGCLSYTAGVDRFALIGDMPVVDVATGETLTLRKIGKPYSDAWLAEMT